MVFYIIPKCTGNLPEGGITMLRETFNQAVVRALRARPDSYGNHETPRKAGIFQGSRFAYDTFKTAVPQMHQ